ncbi:MAG TPA: hypothetical protein VGE22_05940 [Solimonas sp.]
MRTKDFARTDELIELLIERAGGRAKVLDLLQGPVQRATALRGLPGAAR